MPTSFTFSDDTLLTPTYLTTSQLTRGSGAGVNDPSQSSAIAGDQFVDFAGDVDVFSMTLVANQSYLFDIDNGAGDAASVDAAITIIDARGNQVAFSDDGNITDNGSASGLDTLLSFAAERTGVYFVAVAEYLTDYVDGSFGFDTSDAGDTGDYRLVVSSGGTPSPSTLTGGSDTRSFGSARENVQALDGDDTVFLDRGADFAHGNAGEDMLYGGKGSDELVGGADADRLFGDADDDVLVGGDAADGLFGGSNKDHLQGDAGDDNLEAGTSNDVLWGEDGRDNLVGGDGDDFLRGGFGVDDLKGGPGVDTFHFLSGEAAFDASGFDEDAITDFADGDLIDLSDLATGSLAFRGSSSFNGANQVRVVQDVDGEGTQEVRVNLDADTSTVELAVLVTTPGFALESFDFVLT